MAASTTETGQGKTFGRLLLEVCSIVLGVLLALAVGEWAEQRREDELALQAIINIQQELRANRELLQQIHGNNQATFDAIGAELDAEEDVNLQFIPGVQMRDTAWQAMLSSGVANYVDYELLLSLGELYSIQEIYRDTGSQLVEASMDMAAHAVVIGAEIDSEAFQRQFQALFSMMLQMEDALLESYAEKQQLLQRAVERH